MRPRGIGLLILLAAALVSPPVAMATPMTYFVNFSGGPTLPALGVFTYDATSGFSNFLVSWNGTLFDLTSAANTPGVGGACPGASSSPATGFALMDHSLCSGVFSRWNGSQASGLNSFSFYNETLALPAQTGAFINANMSAAFDPFPVNAAGDWTLTGSLSGRPSYLINFSGGPTLPALGVFTYDATSGFSNFLVSWNGTLFDLTSAANTPGVGGACPGASSSPATGFALMDHSLCSGVFSRWNGSQASGLDSFSFYNETLALPAQTGAFINANMSAAFDPFPVNAAGDWTLTNLTGVAVPVSEPPTILILLTGLFLLAGWGLLQTRSRRSALT